MAGDLRSWTSVMFRGSSELTSPSTVVVLVMAVLLNWVSTTETVSKVRPRVELDQKTRDIPPSPALTRT